MAYEFGLTKPSVRIELKFAADQIRDRHDRDAILALADPGDEALFGDEVLHLTAPVRMTFRGGRTWLDLPDGRAADARPHINAPLVAGLRRAHATLVDHGAIPQSAPDELFDARAPKSPYLAKLCRLATLAPDIQQAILVGRQPRELTLQRLLDNPIPVSWADQRSAFGFAEA